MVSPCSRLIKSAFDVGMGKVMKQILSRSFHVWFWFSLIVSILLELLFDHGGGSSAHRPSSPSLAARMRISLPRHDLLGEEGWLISQRRRAKSLFLNGLLLGSFCTGIQVKLINHCQAVRSNNR